MPRRGLDNSRRYEIFHGKDSPIHGGIKYSMEGVKSFTVVSNIPQRGLHNSRRYQIFRGGG